MIEEDVINAKDCYDLVKCGIQQRHIAQTKMNDFSSRSHSIFTLWIDSTNIAEGLKSTKRRRLHLIDLAGSECVKKANYEGSIIHDTKNINSSLLQLGNVINALVELGCGKSKIQHIPYRNDKLTFLLKDSLGGNAKTSIIACISSSNYN
jgi:kinesin family protein 15